MKSNMRRMHKEEKMSVVTEARIDDAELKAIIDQQSVRRTWGRIHRLHVERMDGRVIVHGNTASYNSKQLALEAVLEVLGSMDSPRWEPDIQITVITPNRRHTL